MPACNSRCTVSPANPAEMLTGNRAALCYGDIFAAAGR